MRYVRTWTFSRFGRLTRRGRGGQIVLVNLREENTSPGQLGDTARDMERNLIFRWYSRACDWFIPQEHRDDAECYRRGRLITGFGLLGSIFGACYAVFYFLIHHLWGTGIIVVCSLGVAGVPFLMRRTKSLDLPANLLVLILILGFSGLGLVEGGLHGHAIAWLVSVPLCAMVLAGRRAAVGWMFAAFLAAGGLAAVAMCGVHLAPAYDPQWNNIVSAAGYTGLIAFMFILGLIFENGRAAAFAKMQTALTDLSAANERLVGLNNEKTEFLGIAAHDLKNPLMAIMANAELMGFPGVTQVDVTEGARGIVAAASQMNGLISDLLDANAIEEGRFTSDVQACEVKALVERSVANNRVSAGKKGITLRVECPDLLCLRADPKATLQILDNLISNAVKFSPLQSTVLITSSLVTRYILVAVRDQGPGISEEDQKRLFGKFTRLSARPTGGESSTGLGLSIVKRLAEAMSGTVSCQSTLGSGAAFILRLPVWTEVAAARRNGSQLSAGKSGRQSR